MEFNGTFFATILTFICFVFVMNKILYEPVGKIVEERTNFLNKNYQDAESNNTKAEELSKEREEKIISSKEDARVKYNEILSGFKQKRTDVVKEAQENSHKEIDSAYENLSNISNDAKENLKWKLTDLANDIVEKVLGYRSEVQGFDNDKVNEILYQDKV